MPKNDYIEKITQNLEHLTKDELKDVATLTNAQFEVRLKVAEKEYWGKEIANLKSQLQQQALPVVPDYVGNAVMKINLEHLFTGYTNGINEKAKNWLERHKGVKSLGYYVCQLRFQGFTIEKPQLFRLKLKNATISNYYLWLNQATGKVFVDKKFLDWTNHNNVKNIFTKQEITKISDGAFVNNEAFELVPVEDGE